MTTQEYKAIIKQLQKDIRILNKKINLINSQLEEMPKHKRLVANTHLQIYHSSLIDTKIQLAHFNNYI